MFAFKTFPSILALFQSVRLESGTDQYDRWKKPPHPSIFKVYFFNITNSYDVANDGATPIVEQVGPYVYR